MGSFEGPGAPPATCGDRLRGQSRRGRREASPQVWVSGGSRPHRGGVEIEIPLGPLGHEETDVQVRCHRVWVPPVEVERMSPQGDPGKCGKEYRL